MIVLPAVPKGDAIVLLAGGSAMGSWARFVRASGFSMPQFMILMHAHYKESCGITDLSEKMDIFAQGRFVRGLSGNRLSYRNGG